MQIKCGNSWFYRVDIVFLLLFFWGFVCARDCCAVCLQQLYLYSSHCVLVCTVDKCPPQLWLLFCCCPVAREQGVCFLQDRVRDKLLIGRSSGLCNNLLIQKHEPCQVLLNNWLLYCAEEKTSFTACLYFSSAWPALLEREAVLLSSITLKCLFRIKHELTWPCLSRSAAIPVNPVRAALRGETAGTCRASIDPGSHPEENLDKWSDPLWDKLPGQTF